MRKLERPESKTFFEIFMDWSIELFDLKICDGLGPGLTRFCAQCCLTLLWDQVDFIFAISQSLVYYFLPPNTGAALTN